jgi:hypothetical protein
MRTIPPALQAKLDSGVTTLCHCWVIRRSDGVAQGFTDHDGDVLLGDINCRAGSGLSGSEAVQKLGLAVDSSELSGALADDTLNEADLAAGRYDAAIVEMWLADWTEPDLRILLVKGTLGEVSREGVAFTAELRGLSERLSQDSGRLYTITCSADLGDARCKVDLSDARFRGSGVVLALSGDYRKYLKPNATAADVRAMKIDDAKRIYRNKYWDAQRCDELPAGVDYAVFDYGVNSGLGRSGKVLRRALKLPDNSSAVTEAVIAATRSIDPRLLIVAICDERLHFLQSLKTWTVFGAGWGRRVADVKSAALAMAADARVVAHGK